MTIEDVAGNSHESEWVQFLEQKNRYIGGVLESDEGVGGLFRGTISSIELDAFYFKICAEDAERSGDGEQWEPVGGFDVGCNIQITPSPVLSSDGRATFHIMMVGRVIMTPIAPANFESKVVVMESGILDKDGHIFSVPACEVYAEECDGVVEYLENGEVRVWVDPQVEGAV